MCGRAGKPKLPHFPNPDCFGRVESINPATEPGTRAILVYVSIPNPEHQLRGGMFATGRIALAAQDPAPALPLNAIRTDAGQTYVWAIVDGRLIRRNVLLGRRDDEAGGVEIRTELPGDLQILAARIDNLKEGARALVKSSLTDGAKAG